MTTQLIEAARLALEALEWARPCHNQGGTVREKVDLSITALRAALEQPAQDEPFKHGGRPMTLRECMEAEEPAQKALEQPAQDEPVAWATYLGECAHVLWGKDRPDYPIRYEVPLYTRPPAREPLTDEQRSWIVATCITPRQIIDLVEKMHGIKGKA